MESWSATLNTVNTCDPVSSGNIDTDGYGVSDVCDQDDDNDGILDSNEGFTAPLELINNGDFRSVFPVMNSIRWHRSVVNYINIGQYSGRNKINLRN